MCQPMSGVSVAALFLTLCACHSAAVNETDWSHPTMTLVATEGDLRGRVAQAVTRDEEDREALKALFAAGDEAAPVLVGFLSNPDVAVRINAARAISYIGERRGLAALKGAIDKEKDTD